MMKKQIPPTLSVVIPVFNESARISFLSEIVKYFRKQTYSVEIVLVNDGSKDNTLSLLKGYAKKNTEIKIISYAENRGKGHAIKMGMLQAKGKHRLFTDIDLSTPLSEFKKFIPLLGKKEVIIGTRKNTDASILVHQPFIREYLGKCFTWISRILLGVNLTDFTCGFKCFSAKAANDIFSRSQIERWGFDAEIMFIAHKRGYFIQEVSVIWRNDERTKVKLLSAAFKSFQELLTIRLADIFGKYR